MPTVEAYRDNCRTAADVMERAREVRQKRMESLAPPKVVYVQLPAPEPIVKVVKPSIVEMLHAISDHYRISQAVLLESIADLMPRDGETTRVGIERIQRAVAKASRVEWRDMISARRTADVTRPRQMAMALCKRLTVKSLPEIGRRFGGRDHTTILHAVRKYQPLVNRVDSLLGPNATVDDWARGLIQHYDKAIDR